MTTALSKTLNDLLKVPEVQSKLTPKEMSVAVAGSRQAIRECDLSSEAAAGKQANDISEMLTFIFQDLSIRRKPEMYEKARFVDVLRKYYGQLSQSDIKLAFEMYNVGELKEQLEGANDGKPVKHYGEWSLEFACSVLNAYKQLRSGVWCKVHAALPEHKKTPSEQEVHDMQQRFKGQVVKAFNDFKNDGIRPDFPVRALVMKLLEQNGYLIDIKVTDEMRSRAVQPILHDSTLSVYVKLAEENRWKEGGEGVLASVRLASIVEREQIIRAFTMLIEQEIDIAEWFDY